MSRRTEVVVVTPPPVRIDAVVWPRIRETAAHLGSAIEEISILATTLALSSASRPQAITTVDGNVLANVFGMGEHRGRIVHTADPGPSDGEPVRIGIDCSTRGQRYVLEIVCALSHAPSPVPVERMGEHDQVKYVLGFFRSAIRICMDDLDIVHDAVPEELRLACLGATFEDSGIALPIDGHEPGIPVRATGRTDLGDERLDIGWPDAVVSADRIIGLPAVLRLDVVHDPDGPINLSARLSAQRIATDAGTVGPLDRMRAIAAWREHLAARASREGDAA